MKQNIPIQIFLLFDIVLQSPTLTEICDYVAVILCIEDIMKFDYIWMVKLPQNADFVLK